MVRRAQHLRYYLKSIVRELRERSEGAENKLNNEPSRSAIGNQKRRYSKNSCRFTTYRHRFARVAPLLEQIAPPRSSSKKLIVAGLRGPDLRFPPTGQSLGSKPGGKAWGPQAKLIEESWTRVARQKNSTSIRASPVKKHFIRVLASTRLYAARTLPRFFNH